MDTHPRKVAVVTGANTGIGLEIARSLVLENNYHVILACRDKSKAEQAKLNIEKSIECSNKPQDQLGKAEVMLVDLSKLSSVVEFANEFKSKNLALNLLILNAGIGFNPYMETKDGIEMCYGVNYVGHFLLTNLLFDNICKSAPARIVIVNAGLYVLGDIVFDEKGDVVTLSKETYGWMGLVKAYANSKLALLLWMRELTRRIQDGGVTGVTVTSLHPGVIRTELGRYTSWWQYALYKFQSLFLRGPVAGAKPVLYLATSPEVEGVTDKYYMENTQAEFHDKAKDLEAAKKLWTATQRLVDSILSRPSNL